MKAYLKVEKQPMPNHVERPFIEALGYTAKEHGYTGVFASTRFLWSRTKDHWLQVISRIMPLNSIRVKLQRMRGVKIAEGVHIGPMVTIDDVYPYFVSIGKRTAISGNNFILTHTKPMVYHSEVSEAYVAPVIIEDDVWIAISVDILPGVTIGEGSIIASGSVVTKSIPPLVFAAGSPAEVKKDLAQKLKKNYTEEQFQRILKKRKAEYGF
ncbi:MAG: acyltransferase [Candidatus Cloacimonetes bacterium]|nr:acyltransferase [Candidatus Cloacimonadota bacterium]